jgi:hypothetical protein
MERMHNEERGDSFAYQQPQTYSQMMHDPYNYSNNGMMNGQQQYMDNDMHPGMGVMPMAGSTYLRGID